MSKSTANKPYTRSDYMNKRVDHHTYYLHLAHRSGNNHTMFTNDFKQRILKSTDPHFNDISLKIWDKLSIFMCDVYNINDNGTKTVSLSDRICALKALARDYKQSHYINNTTVQYRKLK